MTVTEATGEYTVVGTVPYMSPEQAAAMPVDKRSDIWAFGCILYELLTGQRAFAGDTVSDTLAAIHGRDPDWDQLPPDTPVKVRDLLLRCLQKDPDARLHDVADARIEILDVRESHSRPHSSIRGITPPRSRSSRITRIASMALVLAAVTIFVMWALMNNGGGLLGQPNPPVVMLMDTAAPRGVYDPATRRESGTNADDLSHILSGLPFALHKETLSSTWDREDQVLRQHPDLILIHRSAFFHSMNPEFDIGYPPFDNLEGNAPREGASSEQRFNRLYAIAEGKLAAFLGYIGLGSPETRFLVYSRGAGGEWTKDAHRRNWIAVMERRFPSLAGRVFAMNVPDRYDPLAGSSSPHTDARFAMNEKPAARGWMALPTLVLLSACTTPSTELVTLGPSTWDAFAPRGKEVDAVHGDLVLRNDHLVAVIARPVAGRNANMTVHDVGGALIDLTALPRQSDQLSAFYPGGGHFTFTSPDAVTVLVDGERVAPSGDLRVRGSAVTVECTSDPADGRALLTVRYTLTVGAPFLRVESVYRNPHDQPVEVELVDALRADRSFAFGMDPHRDLFWAQDDWFGQTYGFAPEDHAVRPWGENERRPLLFRYAADGEQRVTLAPGGSHVLVRKVVPAADLLQLMGIVHRLAGDEVRTVTIRVTDPAGPVAGARVSVIDEKGFRALGRTPEDGTLTFELPPGGRHVEVAALGRPDVELELAAQGPIDRTVELEAPGYVVARITDESGGPIPCKVQFRGIDGTPAPHFGPDTGAVAVENLHYSHDGRFRQEIGPGRYEVIVSHGPEYDAVFQEIEVVRARETTLAATLVRSVDTTGWVSSDFHSHSSPSGDNTSSQLGRVLNLLCEHVEFAPCTEHNRLSTYAPHLERLGVRDLMATCTGMELTGGPGNVNHQNAFPLVLVPGAQDAGAPLTDRDPRIQIERLALWDEGSEKLVQQNHPDVRRILADRDADGRHDGGYERMFSFMDVIEVHPPAQVLTPPVPDAEGLYPENRMFRWLQTLNLGYRVPGVVNTDAHYNAHGSGFLRNYLRSPTDDPAEIRTLDMVHAAEEGRVVMTNGPFLEVSLRAEEDGPKGSGSVGDEVVAPGGRARLSVRVQCPNWLDVNRVQVLVNGRAVESLNHTRRSTPRLFGDETVAFEAAIPLSLERDAHVVVVAAGVGLRLGPVMGSQHAEDVPIAVSNPIFVDVDGDGFRPNGDLLGFPLPRPGPEEGGG